MLDAPFLVTGSLHGMYLTGHIQKGMIVYETNMYRWMIYMKFFKSDAEVFKSVER